MNASNLSPLDIGTWRSVGVEMLVARAPTATAEVRAAVRYAKAVHAGEGDRRPSRPLEPWSAVTTNEGVMPDVGDPTEDHRRLATELKNMAEAKVDRSNEPAVGRT